jgi:gamma-glutamylcyclotransferase (GGCT)/AIG2-like uncharacterized protein YtfP
MPRHLIFVYGTLKRSFPNAAHMPKNAIFLGPATTVQAFPLTVGAGVNCIPFLLYRPGRGHVISGELYQLEDDEGLRYLDDFEGTSWGFYKRIEIEVRLLACDTPDGRPATDSAGAEGRDGQDSPLSTPASEILKAGTYFRGEGGARWPEDELGALEHLKEYTLELAEKYLPRDHPDADREGLMTSVEVEKK